IRESESSYCKRSLTDLCAQAGNTVMERRLFRGGDSVEYSRMDQFFVDRLETGSYAARFRGSGGAKWLAANLKTS
ncbi:MAG: hypothetical protein PVH39_05010, partial [Syntrophobacterales bacterium]